MTDINGQSFVGRLACQTDVGEDWVDALRSQDVAGGGWLVQGVQDEGAQAPLLLRFDFIEQVGERLHYHISVDHESLGDYPGARMGVSRNGYLGLYSVAGVSAYWKIETLPHDLPDDHFVFTLRDIRGYRVAVNHHRKGSVFNSIDAHAGEVTGYLNVEKGLIARFCVKVERYV